MLRKVKLPLLLTITGLTLLLTSGQTGAPRRSISREEVLMRRTGATENNGAGVVDALVLGLTIAQVPGGIVNIVNCGGRGPEVSIKADSSVKDLLDQIVLASPEYRWDINDGVVNLIPGTSFPVPLEIEIAEFKVEDISASDALNRLLEVPEVRQGIESLNLHQGGRALGGGFSRPTRISLDLKDVTLREALNAIVRANGRALWAYTLRPCDGRNEYNISLLID